MSTVQPLLLRIREILSSVSETIRDGNGSSLSELVNVLETISGSSLAENDAFEVLCEIHKFVVSDTLEQEIMDELSFEVPKVVAKFAGLSSRCLDVVDNVIDRFIEACSARDMFAILCEALSASETAYILRGLSKVLLSLRQCHFEQLKSAFPIILNVLKKTCSDASAREADTEMADENKDSITLFSRAIGIADSIKTVCTKSENKVNEDLRALLGLYVLQIMALLSLTAGEHMSSYVRFVSQLTEFFSYCGLSYIGLVTGSDVDVMAKTVTRDEDDDLMSCLCYVKQGACLSVIWGRIYDDSLGGEQIVSILKDELQNSQANRWKAIGMLQHILASTDMLWELKNLAINFIVWFTDGTQVEDDEKTDCSAHLPGLLAASEAITNIMVNAQSSEFTENAFVALQRVLDDTPTHESFYIVKYLTTHSDSSMIPLLFKLVKKKLLREYPPQSESTLWNPEVLRLVEMVLKPPGRPPCLPEDGIPVLAALNLYRFILIRESAGKSNYTGVLLEENLRKANSEWLLPLRNLVTGILQVNKSEETSHVAADKISATLDPIVAVLYRCIHFVEEKLRSSGLDFGANPGGVTDSCG